MNKGWKKAFFVIIVVLGIIGILATIALIQVPTSNVRAKGQDEIRIVSYNLKNGESDLDTTFSSRKQVIVKQLLAYDADSIGVQEADWPWMDSGSGLPALLTGYDYVGIGRDPGGSGEYASIFYDSDKYNVIDSGTFWLSETPDQVSIGWDASTYRICTWVILENKVTGYQYAHYNTHLDHEGEEARKKSIELILAELDKQTLPFVLTGDFNFTEGSSNYKTITANYDDSKKIANHSMSHGTINYFLKFNTWLINIVIDFAFLDESDWGSVVEYQVDNTYRLDKNPVSDHFPVIVTLKPKNP